MTETKTFRQVVEDRRDVLKRRRVEYSRWLGDWNEKDNTASDAVEWANMVDRYDCMISELGYLLAQDATN